MVPQLGVYKGRALVHHKSPIVNACTKGEWGPVIEGSFTFEAIIGALVSGAGPRLATAGFVGVCTRRQGQGPG